ncbi:glycerophosphodiester phosphodiesterase [Biformimicrobium ophioploci]|nr:glycerophosphodiester phosphodiesterase [Microbulbifer sp. NKW57]
MNRLFTQLRLLLLLATAAQAGATPAVIAHRGASGYLPEHTLEAKALAYAMRPDYIEQDLVMTRDNRLIVLHDIYLEAVTNVAEKFPGRAREDGHFYVVDFDLDEIRQLRVSERFETTDAGTEPYFPGRFPVWQSAFSVHTFAEEIELIQGLNRTLGHDIGIYPEIKAPWHHRREGKDIARATLEVLKRYGYGLGHRGKKHKTPQVLLQSFDANELQRIRSGLMEEVGIDVPLVQLIAPSSWELAQEKVGDTWRNYEFEWMLTEEGMDRVATYADGIGPAAGLILPESESLQGGQPPAAAPWYRAAKNAGLTVHAYTFRADQLPEGVPDFASLVKLFSDHLQVDGLFTDHPDKVREILKAD